MEVIRDRCAGLDVHKETVVVSVRIQQEKEAQREVPTFATMWSILILVDTYTFAIRRFRVRFTRDCGRTYRETNAVWVNEKALRRREDREWTNYGGDRVWISPEVDTNIVEHSGRFEIAVPRSVDPGTYEIAESGADSCTLQARATVTFRRAAVDVDLTWSRRVEVLDEVLYEASGVRSVGYRTVTTLEAAGPLPAGSRPGIWSLFQVPPQSRLLIPCRGAAPRWEAFIGQPAVDVVDGPAIAISVGAAASFKLGLSIDESFGATLAQWQSGDEHVLVVRAFKPGAAERYADVPAANPDAFGFVHQVYVDDGRLGGFGEIEHHSPSLSAGQDVGVMDETMTYAYVGDRDAVATIMNHWLERVRRSDETRR